MQNKANPWFACLTYETMTTIPSYHTENIPEQVKSNSIREKFIVSDCYMNTVVGYNPIESIRFERISDAATNCSSYHPTF